MLSAKKILWIFFDSESFSYQLFYIFQMRFTKAFSLNIILAFLSLNGNTQNKQINSNQFFDYFNFSGDTLYIKGRFTECGEWGGHLELSKIYFKNKDLYITYTKFSADCDKIGENNGQPPQKLIKRIIKKLFKSDEMLIRRYLHQFIDAKFRESFPGNAGYIFEIRKSDDTMNLHIYTFSDRTKNEYVQFIKEILK